MRPNEKWGREPGDLEKTISNGPPRNPIWGVFGSSGVLPWGPLGLPPGSPGAAWRAPAVSRGA